MMFFFYIFISHWFIIITIMYSYHSNTMQDSYREDNVENKDSQVQNTNSPDTWDNKQCIICTFLFYITTYFKYYIFTARIITNNFIHLPQPFKLLYLSRKSSYQNTCPGGSYHWHCLNKKSIFWIYFFHIDGIFELNVWLLYLFLIQHCLVKKTYRVQKCQEDGAISVAADWTTFPSLQKTHSSWYSYQKYLGCVKVFQHCYFFVGWLVSLKDIII